MTKQRATPPRKKIPASRMPYIVHGAAALIWILQAALLARAVESLVSTQQADLPVNWTIVFQAAIGIIVLGVIRHTTEAWSARRIFLQARSYLTQLRRETINTLAQQSPLDKQRPASGTVASMLSDQAEAIVPWMTRYQSAQWRTMVAPLAIALVVGWQSWIAALILIVSAPLIPLFMAIVGWRAQAASEKQMVEMGQMNGFLLDRLRGLSTLRAMHAIDATTAHVRQSGESLTERTMAVLRIAFLSSAILELFSALGVAMVAVYVGFHFLGNLPFGAWGGTLTMGQGLFVLLLAPAFFEPLRELSAAWHDRASGIAAINNIAALSAPTAFVVGNKHTTQQTTDTTTTTDTPVEVSGTPAPFETVVNTAVTTTRLAQSNALTVDIRNLTFAHAAETPVFRDLNLRIDAGEHIALTGASGSGKSILLALIAGLLTANKGSISFNGVEMNDANAAQLRQHIAWMGQTPHIFTGSINTNLFLGREVNNPEAIKTSLQQTGMDDVLRKLPAHILGEGGLGLSGGEIARLTLVRLAAQSNAGLIIMDEPTAHLDTETAIQVIEAIKSIARNTTLIVATHDPMLLSRMDREITLYLSRVEAKVA